MREETRIAAAACVAALNTVCAPEDWERHSRPPYPLPEGLVAHRDVVSAEIARLRREGATDCVCVLTTLEQWSDRWEKIADRLESMQARELFGIALALLSAAGGMSPDEFEAIIPLVPDDIARNKLRSQLIHQLLVVGDVARAEQVSETFEAFSGRDQRFLGHRRVALWFAQRGDAAAFFVRWRRLEASQERHHMGELKQTLIRSVGDRHGWRQAMSTVSDRRFGPAYRSYAFTSLVEAGAVDQLSELFAEEDGLLDELDELTVLATALARKAAHTKVAARQPLTTVLHRIIAIDPSDKQAMRRRDGMMLTLWPAYPDGDALALARKSVRAPWIRRELTGLHPDIDRPG